MSSATRLRHAAVDRRPHRRAIAPLETRILLRVEGAAACGRSRSISTARSTSAGGCSPRLIRAPDLSALALPRQPGSHRAVRVLSNVELSLGYGLCRLGLVGVSDCCTADGPARSPIVARRSALIWAVHIGADRALELRPRKVDVRRASTSNPSRPDRLTAAASATTSARR